MTTVLESGNTESVKAGRERGAFVYSANEHLALLVALQSTPNSFNVGEGCDEWRSAYQEMVTSYYHPNNRITLWSCTVPLKQVFGRSLYSQIHPSVLVLSLLPTRKRVNFTSNLFTHYYSLIRRSFNLLSGGVLK
jgi:hypothetical protein